MRHFRSVSYALVLAPAVWVLVAVGLAHQSWAGLLLLLLGGAAYGILLLAPISPLGPTAAGVVFLALGGWAIEDPSTWSPAAARPAFDLTRPGYAVAALLSAPLLLTALRVRRRRGDEPVEPPLAGPIGRPRGSGADDSERTTSLRLPEGPDERTTLLRRPGPGGPASTEPTTVVRVPAEGDVPTEAPGPEPGDATEGEAVAALMVESADPDTAADDVVAAGGAGDGSADGEPGEAVAAARGSVATGDDESSGLVPVLVSVATPVEVPAEAEEQPASGLTTYLIVTEDGEPTQQIGFTPARPEPGDRTVVMRPGAHIPAERTQILRVPGEETQVIPRRNADGTRPRKSPEPEG